MGSNAPVKTRDDLSMAYTPGVARVCQAIAEDPESVWNLTIKRNTVAVVTDGSAVLGLGDIGPEAAMPVMEGKALLFKEFGGVDAWPICLSTQDPDAIVAAVEAIAPGFGGINLEDIAAPRCFEVEERLRAALDIPVFHDDQHGTAVVVLAAFLNALRVVGKRIEDVKVVLTGVGAAGVAVTKTLQAAGVRNVVGCDTGGAVYRGRAGSHGGQGRATPRRPTRRTLAAVRTMRSRAPTSSSASRSRVPSASKESAGWHPTQSCLRWRTRPPRWLPKPSPALLPSIATGRSDYPNQINNVLAFPGIFRGAFDVRASRDHPRAWRSPPATRSRRRSPSASWTPTTSSRASSTATSSPPSRPPSPRSRSRRAWRGGRARES